MEAGFKEMLSSSHQRKVEEIETVLATEVCVRYQLPKDRIRLTKRGYPKEAAFLLVTSEGDKNTCLIALPRDRVTKLLLAQQVLILHRGQVQKTPILEASTEDLAIRLLDTDIESLFVVPELFENYPEAAEYYPHMAEKLLDLTRAKIEEEGPAPWRFSLLRAYMLCCVLYRDHPVMDEALALAKQYLQALRCLMLSSTMSAVEWTTNARSQPITSSHSWRSSDEPLRCHGNRDT